MTCNARVSNLTRCFELRAEMKAKGLQASEVTFGILLDACVSAGELDQARHVFEDLCSSGLELNKVHCTTFIKGLISAEKLEEAEHVLREMLSSNGARPDLVTYSMIVKAHADNGNAKASMRFLRQMLSEGIEPDEIVFNSVLSAACCESQAPWKAAEVERLFETLVGLGMKPTTATLSVMLKAWVRTGAWDAGMRLLESTEQRFGLKPEMRLFTQLVEACIKARSGWVALQIVKVMLNEVKRRGEKLQPALTTRLFRTCALNADFETAAKLHELAKQEGLFVEPQILKMLKDAAARRGKSSLLPDM